MANGYNHQRYLLNQVKNLLMIGGSGSCGSKLLHKVLGLHPDLYGFRGGETVAAPYYLGAWVEMKLPLALEESAKKGAAWLVDATPDNCVWYHAIRQAMHKCHVVMPDMRYVHIIRDYDRTVESIMRRGVYTWTTLPKHGGDRAGVEAFVTFANSVGMELVRETDGRVVDFDRLVLDPESELKPLCEWLGVAPPIDAMLLYPYDKRKAVP